MRFSVQIVEKELVEERKKNNIDLSALDSKLKMEYESRFAKILTKGNEEKKGYAQQFLKLYGISNFL